MSGGLTGPRRRGRAPARQLGGYVLAGPAVSRSTPRCPRPAPTGVDGRPHMSDGVRPNASVACEARLRSRRWRRALWNSPIEGGLSWGDLATMAAARRWLGRPGRPAWATRAVISIFLGMLHILPSQKDAAPTLGRFMVHSPASCRVTRCASVVADGEPVAQRQSSSCLRESWLALQSHSLIGRTAPTVVRLQALQTLITSS